MNRLSTTTSNYSTTRQKFPFFEPRIVEGNNHLVFAYVIDFNEFLFYSNPGNRIWTSGQHLNENGWEALFKNINSLYHKTKTQIMDFLAPPFTQKTLKVNYVISQASAEISVFHEIFIYTFHSITYALNFLKFKDESSSCFIQKTSRPKSCPMISDREKEVLVLIGNGYSSKEIAEKLFISDHTVISHRKNLIEKFKVKNTAHLIKEAFKEYLT